MEDIKATLSSKDTPTLLNIWETNDREAYTDGAFTAIRQLLQERSVDVPEQLPHVKRKQKQGSSSISSAGGKLIIASAVLAVGSLFLRWADYGVAHMSANGLEEKAAMLLVLWLYPAYAVVRKRRLNRTAGLLCAVVASVYALVYACRQDIAQWDSEPLDRSKAAMISRMPGGADMVDQFDKWAHEAEEINRKVRGPIVATNGAGYGVWLFLFASILLGTGVMAHRVVDEDDRHTEAEIPLDADSTKC